MKPALRWLDYLVINELEAQALTGIELRSSGTLASPAAFAAAARWLLAQGVRQRVVIHAPEGAWGHQPAGDGLWQPAVLSGRGDCRQRRGRRCVLRRRAVRQPSKLQPAADVKTGPYLRQL